MSTILRCINSQSGLKAVPQVMPVAVLPLPVKSSLMQVKQRTKKGVLWLLTMSTVNILSPKRI
ncbi:unnamed protein product [Prunus brigantina]